MSKYKVYTPDGVQDILFDECLAKREIETKARNLFKGRGYREIETPTIEFYDIYSVRQKALSQETMFKFCDKEGKILVLRPDLTVPAVRVATSKLKDLPRPLPLCYIGNSFRFNGEGGGRQKEYTQAGIEIIGAEGPKADAEIIATAIELVLEAGLTSFQIDIGQVEFFKGLMAQAGFSKEETEEIRILIDNKDYAGMERIMADRNIQEGLKETILNVPKMFGSKEIIEELYTLNLNDTSKEALDNLTEILNILDDYGYSEYVSIDLGMLPGLDYYTGIIFRGFTYGIGFPILSGGRYDKLAETFGKKEAATGFSLGINLLITAMRRQNIVKECQGFDFFIAFDDSERKAALEKAAELRKSGNIVLTDVAGLTVDEAMEYAVKNNYSNLIYISEGQKVNSFDLTDILDGKENEI